MIQSPKKIRLEVLYKTQVICSSGHEDANIFVKEFRFTTDTVLQL